MKSTVLLLLSLPLVPVVITAEPVIGILYSSTCNVQGYPTVVGNQTCFNDPTGSGNKYPTFGLPEAYATSSATSNLAGFTTEVHGTATAFGSGAEIPGSIYSGFNSATAQFSSSDYLATGGPVRSGVLKASINNFGTGGSEMGDSAFSSLYISLLDNNSNLIGSSIGCSGNYHSGTCDSIGSALIYYDSHGGFPVQLGMPFLVTYSGRAVSASGGPSADSYFGYANLDMSIQFSLFEANGVTPVAVVSAAPEPASHLLISLPLIAFALVRRLSLQRQD